MSGWLSKTGSSDAVWGKQGVVWIGLPISQKDEDESTQLLDSSCTLWPRWDTEGDCADWLLVAGCWSMVRWWLLAVLAVLLVMLGAGP